MRDRDLYSIDEVRERLGGISRNSIYQLLRKGQLASVIIGTRRLISAAAIAQLIANSTTTSPTVAAARVPLRSARKLAANQAPVLGNSSQRFVRRHDVQSLCAIRLNLNLDDSHLKPRVASSYALGAEGAGAAVASW